MTRCVYKEHWNRHDASCPNEASCTVEMTPAPGVRVHLALCAEHRETVMAVERFKAVDISNTEEAVHK